MGGIPSHPEGISERGGWPFLPFFPLSKSNEKLDEPLCGSPPLPLVKESLSDCLFEGASCLIPQEVDNHKSICFLLLGPIVLKFTFIVVVYSLSLEGRAIV